MSKKKRKKTDIPFNGIVAQVEEGAGDFAPYWVGIKQTPKAYKALNSAMETLNLRSHGISKEEAELLRDTTNKEYQKNPDSGL